MRLRSRQIFESVRTEGGLLPADLLQRIADGDAKVKGLTPADYHLAPNERLTEAISRSWTRLTAAWQAFSQAREVLPANDVGTTLTRERWLHLLFDELGYGRLTSKPAIEIGDKPYPIFTQWQHTPIQLIGFRVSLDTRTAGVRGAAGQSPHSLMQEVLNRSPERLWGIVSNGLRLRLLRDNVALTRQAYVEFDLEAMFASELYSDFVLLWLVCHQSRVEGEAPAACRLEEWTEQAAESGVQALDQLRFGVERAIQALGRGFLAHRANTTLHEALREGDLDKNDYYRQLLRLVYRLLFLCVAEDRDVLLRPNASAVARERYVVHYSTRRLRRLAGRRRGGAGHHDLYEQLRIVMDCLYEEGHGGLGLPALGSYLWSPEAMGPLGAAQLGNSYLLEALRELAYVEDRGVRRAVDFRNLGAEELGSIYESLLELHPVLDRETAGFRLDTAAGHERKTTGTYYTPTGLISSLLNSALEPVLDEAVKADDPAAAILDLTVCDPACGSGHFLIAAAHRMAKRLAAIRTGEPEPSPQAIRPALREVIGRCIHGVDVNPMAVELCKVSLWLEALEPGKPLSFLDHRIVVGNALLGTTPALIADGIPDDAFKPIGSDDKKVTAELRKRNARQRSGQLGFELGDPLASARELAALAERVDETSDATLETVRERERRHLELIESDARRDAKLLADLWCAAFVQRKERGQPALTHGTFEKITANPSAALPEPGPELADLAREMRLLHWHVAFPNVFRVDGAGKQGWEGGFDVVLGNPPWERLKLQEKEFFAAREPCIATAANKAARERLINELEQSDPALFGEWRAAQRDAEGASRLIRDSGRYPLCGRGDVNTYSIFAETMRSLICPTGRVGCIVPSGIATDDGTKHFFTDLVDRHSLISLFEFRNKGFFPDVAGAQGNRFCLLTVTGDDRPSSQSEFCFRAIRLSELADPGRRFTLTAEDFALLNPNTRTCPIFRTARDAELTRAIYRRVPVLVDKTRGDDDNPWGNTFMRMFDMANDSGVFRTRDELEVAGFRLDGNVFRSSHESYAPLYEGKMIHHFHHRFGDYALASLSGKEVRQLPEAPANDLADPTYTPLSRYWVATSDVDSRLDGRWDRNWLLGWRRNGASVDERTFISCVIPAVGAGDSLFLMYPSGEHPACLVANLASFALDYAARQKLGGVNLSYFVVEQLPVPAPGSFRELAAWSSAETLDEWITPRVLELTFTSRDLQPFARDCGYAGPPFPWNSDRRFILRAELDAAFFHLYEIERDDVDYILDTFPIVRRKDEEAYGEYRTKRVILQIYDEIAKAVGGRTEYRTLLAPPPADRRIAPLEGSRA